MTSQPEEIEIIDKRRARMAAEDDASLANEPAASAESLSDSELAALREQADTYYKNWQRSAADFVNYKRRIEQDRAENARLANAALLINILPVFDDFDRAVSTVDANLAGLNWVQGVVAIHRKFSQLIDAMGAKEIEAAGLPFDPSRHEAVSQMPGAEGQVLHVVQKGYTISERVIRPAMVIVGSGEPLAARA